MNRPMRTIEIDADTAATLESLAKKRGVSLAQLLGEFADVEGAQNEADEQVAELMRRSAAVKAGEPTVSHDDVVRWLKTWGTASYRPWPAGK